MLQTPRTRPAAPTRSISGREHDNRCLTLAVFARIGRNAASRDEWIHACAAIMRENPYTRDRSRPFEPRAEKALGWALVHGNVTEDAGVLWNAVRR